MMKINIDWNIWHYKVKEAIDSFMIDDMMEIVKRLELEWGEDDPVSYTSITALLNTAMEWIIEHYMAKWDGKMTEADRVKYYRFNCYKDEAGFITVEQHFHMNTTEEVLDPYLKITLKPVEQGSDDMYFDIVFICASQMW